MCKKSQRVILPFDPDDYPDFDLLIEAVTCPANRWYTSIEHGNCGEEKLYLHPEWLVDRFIQQGGQEKSAENRARFGRVPCPYKETCGAQQHCAISLVEHHWRKCPVPKLACKAGCAKSVDPNFENLTPQLGTISTRFVRFDNLRHNKALVLDALTHPINRHATRVKYSWDDWDLFRHKDSLITHYTQNGGAVEFEKRWAEFTETLCPHIEKCAIAENCDSKHRAHDHQHCVVQHLPCLGHCKKLT
ncbi:MAG: hypothetical protein WCO30_01945 [bacterium]